MIMMIRQWTVTAVTLSNKDGSFSYHEWLGGGGDGGNDDDKINDCDEEDDDDDDDAFHRNRGKQPWPEWLTATHSGPASIYREVKYQSFILVWLVYYACILH